MKLFILIICLIVPSAILADSSRSRTIFTSKNDKYELVLTNNRDVFQGRTPEEKWALIHKSTKKELYQINEHFWSKIALVSSDGRSVVKVDDYSLRDYKDNPEVLTFYHNGKKTKSYLLSDLFDNKILTHVTASHFTWSNFDEDKSGIDNSRFKLTTFELNQFTFDVRTGKVLEKKRDTSLTKDSVFVTGFIKHLEKNLYEITVDCAIYGNISEGAKVQVEFENNLYREPHTRYPTIIKDKKIVRSEETSGATGCDSKASFLEK